MRLQSAYKTIALVGNPNVGKSTLFNKLTGMHQHTGNWCGKTVSVAQGTFHVGDREYRLIDLPGTYSLNPLSAEEEVTRDFLLKEQYDLAIVVCDATCLERNLLLVLHMKELCSQLLLCVNLMDEAARKGISIDLDYLEKALGVPVVGSSASQRRGLHSLKKQLQNMTLEKENQINTSVGTTAPEDMQLISRLASSLAQTAVSVHATPKQPGILADRILTGKYTAYPFMLLLLALIFWLTITGANYPSALLSQLFHLGEERLFRMLLSFYAPTWLSEMLITGVYRVLTWIISVMLPPMTIFFPLFTLLEDMGYLPRIAYNLDCPFEKCRSCGKQALTMTMGFGCNAVGVTGCRIIGSPRERLIAILTNSFVPCNGRFPTLITMITLFFVGSVGGSLGSLTATLVLTGFILFSILMTLVLSRLLSATLLKGLPSFFVLELPPYRRPKVGSVLLRSVFDRTLFVLLRAITVAIPAGILIWGMANITLGNSSLLVHTADFLEPFAKLLGLDGVILLAFILGMPANEIVLPIILMAYSAQSSLMEIKELSYLKVILVENGWTWKTALCTCLFSLLHWPCTTTLLTIKKETGSLKWTLIAFLLPTVCGIITCILVNLLLTLL